MRHIRDVHGIEISGSNQKRKLLEMGYYHGYKAFRFHRDINNPFHVQSFEEIINIYEFDSEIKEILYSSVMKLETTLKNHTIDVIVSNGKTDIESIFDTCLNAYKEHNFGSSKYKKDMREKLKLKQKFDSVIADNYSSQAIIQHYVHNNEPVPVWAIFELLTLGDYGTFVSCLNTKTRLELEDSVGILDVSSDTDGSNLTRHIFILKELRNAIAHNKIVFDCRFKTVKIRTQVTNQLMDKTNVNEMTFNNIVDYLILIIYYQKSLCENKTKMNKLIKSFSNSITKFKGNVNSSIFDKILGTDVFNKVERLEKYINS